VKGQVRIIDDYGHHPVEIAAVLKRRARCRAAKGVLVAVCQPHRYTRLRDLFEEFSTCFDQADHVLVAPVYEAGETPIDGVNHETLVKGLINHGHRSARAIDGLGSLASEIRNAVKTGDEMVVCLGAGDITSYANALADDLRALKG
jgi:UDP-N-acetylmuramate--alanine ligase